MSKTTSAPSYVTAEQYVADFIKKPNQVDLFIANAPFMTLTQLTKLFKCYDYAILAIASALKVPINSAYAEIPLACIISRLGAIPPNAVIKHLSRGTLVILPKDKKYVRTLHHFSDGYKDKRTAAQSKIKELPPHLQTLMWEDIQE